MQLIYYPYPKKPFLKPEDVVAEFDLSIGDRVLDFGAGAGYWTIPLAQVVGSAGHVFVTDPKPTNLSVIKSKAKRSGLDNLSYYQASYNCSQMPVQTKVDMILCSNILSMVQENERVLQCLKKLAQEGTKLAIIDWDPKSTIGPKKEERINVEEAILKLGKLGFEFKKLLSAGQYHNGLFFVYQK